MLVPQSKQALVRTRLLSSTQKGLQFALLNNRSKHASAVLLAVASQHQTGQAAIMPIESSMRDKINATFSPTVLTIRNDSAKHAHHAAMVAQGGGSGETHFFVEIVSDAFSGKTQIARHRAVNALMKDEFDQGLHALSLRTKTEAEIEREKKMEAGHHQ